MFLIDESYVWELAHHHFGIQRASLRVFKAHFVFSPSMVAIAWNRMLQEGLLDAKAMPQYFLWMLYHLKVYPTVDVGANFCRCNKDTFAKWCNKMVMAVSSLHVVSSIATASLSTFPIDTVASTAFFSNNATPLAIAD